MSMKRYKCRKAPRSHSVMRDELCDERTRNEFKASLHNYRWNTWDMPMKRQKSWKDTTKCRHQYYTVEF